MAMIGKINKLTHTSSSPVAYALPLSDHTIALTPLLGQKIKMTFQGRIYCTACHKQTHKSFSQGHCFSCATTLARCDMCILKPETCHYAKGTCREPKWAEKYCFTPHYIYLSNTSGLKVGITRQNQHLTRWTDQGATQARPLLKAKNRYLSGLIEVELARFIADKTNWRAMLKGNNQDLDLATISQALLPKIDSLLYELRLKHGFDAITPVNGKDTYICYPVVQFPTKITSHSFDKTKEIEGILKGIKGQYLLLDTGVINMRKFTGYEIEFEVK